MAPSFQGLYIMFFPFQLKADREKCLVEKQWSCLGAVSRSRTCKRHGPYTKQSQGNCGQAH